VLSCCREPEPVSQVEAEHAQGTADQQSAVDMSLVSGGKLYFLSVSLYNILFIDLAYAAGLYFKKRT